MTCAEAQTVLTGVLHGPGGQIVPHATVFAVNETSGKEWTVRSSVDGVYQFDQLPPGTYHVRVELQGFVPFQAAGVEVTGHIRAALDIDLVLRVSSSETMTIEGQTTDTEFYSSRSDRPVVFTSQEVANIPLQHGRTVQSLQPLVPGVLFTESTGSLGQFTAGGARRFANKLFIDGVSADLALDVRGAPSGEAVAGVLPATATSGGTQTIIPLDSVQEIQVHTTTAAPENARSSGAQTLIVTKAGTDSFAGTAFLSIRPEMLAATDWFSNAGLSPKREIRFWNVGASHGGPLRRGRINYFATWEQQAVTRRVATTIAVPSLSVRREAPDAIRPLLNAFPQPNGDEREGNLADYVGTFPVPSTLWTASIRVDGSLGARHRTFLRFNHGASAGDALSSAPYQSPFLSYHSQEAAAVTTLTSGWTATFGQNATNDLRLNGSWHLGDWINGTARHGNAIEFVRPTFTGPEPASSSWLMAVLFPGPSGTVSSGLVGESGQNQFQISDTFAVSHRRGILRMGFEYYRNIASVSGASHRYLYRFGSLTSLLQGRPVLATVTTQEPAAFLRQSWAAFAQDTFRPTSRLTIDYGLRYSVQPAPTPTSALAPLLVDFSALPEIRVRSQAGPLWRTSRNRVAPRAGAAYQLRRESLRTSIVRVGWGLVFDDLASPGGGSLGHSYPYITTRQAAISHFPDLPPELLSGTTPPPFARDDGADYVSFPTNLRPPRTVEWQFGVDQMLGSVQRVSISYVAANGHDLVYWYAYPAGGARPAVNVYSNDGRSEYRALFVEYVKRLSRGWHARVNYGWSRSLDIDSGERLSPNVPPLWIEPSSNWGASDFDRPHLLQAIVGCEVPVPGGLQAWHRRLLVGWRIDLAATARSGAPISVEGPRLLRSGIPYALRPDRQSGVDPWLDDAAAPAGRRLNPAAFVDVSAERQGTWPRNALRASPLYQFDLSLSRSFRLATFQTQLRVDVFNLLNAAAFGPPDAWLASDTFGRSFESQADAFGTGTLVRGGLTPIQQAGGPRAVQITLRWSK